MHLGAERKHILKCAFRDFLPPRVLAKRKQVFGIPVGEWLLHDLKGLFEDVVTREKVECVDLLDFYAIRVIYQEHLFGHWDATPLLWSVFAFQWLANRNL